MNSGPNRVSALLKGEGARVGVAQNRTSQVQKAKVVIQAPSLP